MQGQSRAGTKHSKPCADLINLFITDEVALTAGCRCSEKAFQQGQRPSMCSRPEAWTCVKGCCRQIQGGHSTLGVQVGHALQQLSD